MARGHAMCYLETDWNHFPSFVKVSESIIGLQDVIFKLGFALFLFLMSIFLHFRTFVVFSIF